MQLVFSIVLMVMSIISGQPSTRPVNEQPKVFAGPDRSSVYLLVSAMGWPRTWDSFNNDAAFVPGPRPGVPDMRHYYNQIGQTAARMGVDGVVITTLDIKEPRTPDPMSHWRIRMEGRQDALNEGALAVADRDAIRDGMVLLRQRVGKIILYTGYPNDVSVTDVPGNDGYGHNYLSRDEALCDGYVKCNLGPWLDSGMVEAVIIDSAQLKWTLPVCSAVIRSIKRLYPRVKIGAEGHPMNLYAPQGGFTVQPFSCSLTTYSSAITTNSPFNPRWMIPITDAFSPVIVAFTEPHAFVPGIPNRTYHPSRFDNALDQLRQGRSVAIQSWTVGYNVEQPTEDHRQRWLGFLAKARQIRYNVMNPANPVGNP